ncbi:MAG: hypothetical protein JWN70_617 [Planctomycetaceae bacterium]|nr:hypothetical protein [Planctomycetaceae bacterium]
MYFASKAPSKPAEDERLRELATLFATGILRLRARPSLVTELSPKLSESSGQGLEFQGTKRLSVHSG